MKQRINLHTLLSQATDENQKIASFTLLALGVIGLLADGVITASQAVELFFCADNCLFVRKQLRHRVTNEIMSRGVQLLDIFEVLAAEQAQQEFQRELLAMRFLCLKLLEEEKLAA
jgi:hypothetical protein